MLSIFEKKVAGYVKTNELVGPEHRLLLAVSGGADSTALLHVLHSLKKAGVINCELICAHLNHQLRGNESDLDEEFASALSMELNIPLTIERFDVRDYSLREKLSIETAARELRIQALSRIAKVNRCHAIVTAHQKNDNAETVIQRMARGTGFRGLSGIWPVRIFSDGTRFIKPLLCVNRDEIIAYLQERNLRWRNDQTNEDSSFRRNFIRHKLLPELQRNADLSIVDKLSELARSAREYRRLISEQTDELWPEIAESNNDKIMLDVGILLTHPIPIKLELVRRCLTQIGCGERYLTQKHYQEILMLAENNVTGINIHLPEGFIALRDYGSIVFCLHKKCSVGQTLPYHNRPVTLNIPGSTTFGDYLIEATVLEACTNGLDKFIAGKSNRTERFDFEKIKPPLTIRSKESGDRFVPLGMTSLKKVGKFLTDQRVPQIMREKIYAITDTEKIVWVCPVRINEQAKVTTETKKVLQLQITDIGKSRNSVDAESQSK